jgi:cobyrinic acid a,c-diamide synthase
LTVAAPGGSVPRVVVGGLSSGAGKTTLTVALARALGARGLRVALFKCGPDYLDPTYHARATGRTSHNLDGWMMGRGAVLATFERAARGADIAVIEGVMGLFDGASPTDEEGSTAQIAKWLDAPVLVVVDTSGMARTLAAVARGIAAFDPGLRVAGLVANRVGGRGHLDLLRAAVGTPPVLGGLRDEAELRFPERHLGLRTADDDALPEAVLDRWGRVAGEWLAIDAIIEAARTAGSLANPPREPREPRDDSPAGSRTSCRIAVAHDEAFHFYYEDNLRRLEALGASLVRFSPIRDAALPDADGLLLGGGYPEVHARALADNESMRASVRAFAGRGRPIYAECGGLMYLAQAIRTLDGALHPMVGLVEGEAVMRDSIQALGYVEVETKRETPLGPAGLRFRGHQFRYSELAHAGPPSAYTVRARWGGAVTREGFGHGGVLASYVHAHWASCPLAARGFVDACTRASTGRNDA